MSTQKNTAYPIHSLLQKRKSGRAFEAKEISNDVLNRLLEAAKWAPSSYNEQPWRFLVTKRETAAFDLLLGSLMEANQVWAKNASALVIALSKKTFNRNDKPNRHYAYDLGSAVAHLSIQATEEGLNIRQMGGYDPQKVKENFSIPEELEAFAVLAIGYPSATPEKVLNEQYLQMELAPQTRKEQDEFVSYDTF